MCIYIDYLINHTIDINTVYPKKYAHGFCFAVLCCGLYYIDWFFHIHQAYFIGTVAI